MIHLTSDAPPKAVLDGLEALSMKLANIDHSTQVLIARDLWKTKASTVEGEAVFAGVRQWLKSVSANQHICQYCEHGEPADIEHIYPKSFFPAFTFDWHHYLLSCKQCNTGHKLAKFAIFDGSGNIHRLQQNREPISNDGVFVHPRQDDPSEFMMLNLSTFEFEILHDVGTAAFHKTEFTLDTLPLNRRDPLLAAREKTARHLLTMLRLLLFHLSLNSIDELKSHIHELDFNWNRSLEEIRLGLIQSCKQELQSEAHPSVWSAIKVQYREYTQWRHIFENLQEALDW